jgi:membrane protein CcdC involved in cytochrome C biogenesis
MFNKLFTAGLNCVLKIIKQVENYAFTSKFIQPKLFCITGVFYYSPVFHLSSKQIIRNILHNKDICDLYTMPSIDTA